MQYQVYDVVATPEDREVIYTKDRKATWMLSFLFGLIGVAIDYLLYTYGGLFLPMKLPLLVLMPILVVLPVMLSMLALGIYKNCTKKGRERYGLNKRWLAVILMCIFVLGVVTAGVQYVYSLNPLVTLLPQERDYIFVLDDSGSMVSNDPENSRGGKLIELLDELEENCAAGLVNMSDKFECIEPGALSAIQRSKFEDISSALTSSGGTPIGEALEKALDIIEKADSRYIVRKQTFIVLLTDGYSTDSVDITGILNRCRAKNAVISCIALGNDADMELLNALALGSGGFVQNILEMADGTGVLEAYRSAIRGGAQGRDLVNSRDGYTKYLYWYSLVRVVGWMIISLVAGMFIKILMGKEAKCKLWPVVYLAHGFVIGVAIEACTLFYPDGIRYAPAIITILSLMPIQYGTVETVDFGWQMFSGTKEE